MLNKMNYWKLILSIVAGLIATIVGGFYFLSRVDLLGGKNYLKNASRAFEDITIRQVEHGVKYIDA